MEISILKQRTSNQLEHKFINLVLGVLIEVNYYILDCLYVFEIHYMNENNPSHIQGRWELKS